MKSRDISFYLFSQGEIEIGHLVEWEDLDPEHGIQPRQEFKEIAIPKNATGLDLIGKQNLIKRIMMYN